MWPPSRTQRLPPPPYPAGSAVLTADLKKQLNECLEKLKKSNEENKQLRQDNQELRDLCCFLDDDRQRARKLAKEWQKFGRYTAKVMRQEVSHYQEKLHQLDGRQKELVRDNFELKDLCLYLDEERNCIDLNCPHCGEKILSRPNSVVPPEEDDAVSRRLINHRRKDINLESPVMASETSHSSNSSGVLSMSSLESANDHDKSKEVLNIYQTAIENEDTSETQRAIIKEMCNVVWKSIEKKKP